MKRTTLEKAGISSAKVKEYIELLEREGLSTHDIIIARRGEIAFETYWKPFHEKFNHRMYSITKSYVALAVGFAEQDGLLNLDDTMEKHFPDELKNQTDANMRNQTVRHMLMMSTCKLERWWFGARCDDRVRFYFENDRTESRPSGTTFSYDSTGSFVLGALVERVTGKPLMDYLREKFMDEIGVSKEAYMLKCPGGHSWGDSALVCTPMDLLKVAQFTMNGGKWNGKQLLNEKFVKDATSCLITNNHLEADQYSNQGYGYLIWRNLRNSFFFNGMGCQFAICVPDKELIFIYNADNQGLDHAKKVIIDNFFTMIADTISDEPLAEDAKAQQELADYCDTLELAYAKGEKHTEFENKINGVKYQLEENPMGIKDIKVVIEGDKGKLCYTNAQGCKELEFGLGHNEFSKFPQDGYSDIVGSQPGNRRYDCAASAAWVEPRKLFIKVQIIDNYLGRLNIIMSYREDMKLGIAMNKTAEDFLEEYRGFAGGAPVQE